MQTNKKYYWIALPFFVALSACEIEIPENLDSSETETSLATSGGSNSTAPSLPPVTPSAPDCTTRCDFVGLLTDTNKHTPPGRSAPALHSSYVDPVFATTVTRITGRAQVSGSSRIRHYYSKQNPFNADDSYAIFQADDGHWWLYNAATWEPITTVSDWPHVTNSEPEIQWHPTNPDLFYFLKDENKFARFEISSHTTTILHDFGDDGFTQTAGRLEANMDKSGRFYAMIGKTSGGTSEAFVYDVVNDQLSQRVNVNAIEREGIDWISISQNGNYVVLMGHDHSYVYDFNMNYKGRFPSGSYGHADLCSLSSGREVLVFDGADYEEASDGDRWINMAYLDTVNGNDTGQIDPIAKIGWSTTPHISCRNTSFPGWALVSNQGNGSNNFDKEVYWVKLSGEADTQHEVRRIAHHYSDRESGGYFAEQHAVTNKDGTKIIYASNYGNGEVAAYYINLSEFRRPQ
ncbi:MAG: hypothetical protein P1U67_11370 [Alcanivoracaceae bacterium]|nr:hypothetical protein [Alcanivoracaceae bacterium]